MVDAHAHISFPPARKRRPLQVAVTGHCNLGDEMTALFVAHAFDRILAHLHRASHTGIVALSGLAAGADTLFAEAALAHAIPLEACLASADLIENFPPGLDRDRYLALCQNSQHIHQLPFAMRSNTAYMALGRWLVDSSALLVAAWNGLPAAAEGGSGDVVAYAQQQSKPIIHIHTCHHTIAMLD